MPLQAKGGRHALAHGVRNGFALVHALFCGADLTLGMSAFHVELTVGRKVEHMTGGT